jgi:hypothetical protein
MNKNSRNVFSSILLAITVLAASGSVVAGKGGSNGGAQAGGSGSGNTAMNRGNSSAGNGFGQRNQSANGASSSQNKYQYQHQHQYRYGKGGSERQQYSDFEGWLNQGQSGERNQNRYQLQSQTMAQENR